MSSRRYRKLFRINLGLTRYNAAWEFQKKLVNRRFQGRIPDCLIFTEHEPVITMGRGTVEDNLLVAPDILVEKGIDLFEVERGGDITFHGPGQTVVYPIINLQNRGCDVHQYLRDLEKFIIETLRQIGLEAGTKEGLTGIWVGDYKIGAIGVAVSRWITYHGLALNVSTDLDYFSLINPCGITDYPVGTISDLLDEDIEMADLNNLLAENFADMFGYEMEVFGDLEHLLGEKPRKKLAGL
ncbi:MAG: lipoyl(octanoyl) transferase LipB [Candidatus Zixiibacteriota bacterium]|nr:MAG: lipoyl(octanoyl) transferase LipB [candidate division Zixibacteria bacterium]